MECIYAFEDFNFIKTFINIFYILYMFIINYILICVHSKKVFKSTLTLALISKLKIN